MLLNECDRDRRGGWNRNKITNLVYLQRELRLGRHPEQLGLEIIGRGVQNTVYSFHASDGTEYIVKRFVGGYADGSTQPPPCVKLSGARKAKTIRCKGWVVQEKVVKLLAHCQRDEAPEAFKQYNRLIQLGGQPGWTHDIHGKNCGINAKGQLVVFDW